MENLRSFESTYEELKLPFQKCYCCAVNVLSLPMRNWNTDTFFFEICLNFRFESTYEELKLANIFAVSVFRTWFWVYLWGIETAFQLSSQAVLSWFWVYLWGIETLKNLQQPNKHLLFWVYLWGIETALGSRRRKQSTQFWVYLWGIETWPSNNGWTPHKTVLSLPMRNWNSATRECRWYIHSGFESTYEELKQRLYWLYRKWYCWFWVYLWGIETPHNIK